MTEQTHDRQTELIAILETVQRLLGKASRADRMGLTLEQRTEEPYQGRQLRIQLACHHRGAHRRFTSDQVNAGTSNDAKFANNGFLEILRQTI